MRNTGWNLAGYIAPLVVAIFAVPMLIEGMGYERFGVVAMAWVVIGYLSLMDLGMSRTLTKIVSEKLGCQKEADVPAVVWTASTIMLVFGIAMALVGFLVLPWLVRDFLNIPAQLENETLLGFRILALCAPVVILGIGFRGVLDAYQRFDLTNKVRIPLGIYSFLAPLAVLPFDPRVHIVVGVLALGRVIGFGTHLFFCWRVVPGLGAGFDFRVDMIASLLRFGGWLSLSNVISPVMVYIDRFVIGAVISAAAVAIYAVPHEFVTKLLILPGAMIGVLFPAFSSSFAMDRAQTAWLFLRGTKYVFLVIFPVTLVVITLAEEGLRFWLGAAFSQDGFRVLQWLAAGVFFNSLAHLPHTLIQGIGRPEITAMLHLGELPLYLVGLWWAVIHHGVDGAAIAWTARVVFDCLMLFGVAYRFLDFDFYNVQRQLWAAGLSVLVFLTGTMTGDSLHRVAFLLILLTTYGVVVWRYLLASDERAFLDEKFGALTGRSGRG